MKKSLKYHQFIFAREYRGRSQKALSGKIKGLSQSNLSKFEKGLGGLSEEVLDKMISELRFPKDFFNKEIQNDIRNPHYRKRASVTKKTIVNIERRTKLIGYMIDEMGNSIEWPEFKFTSINLDEGYTPEDVAKHARAMLGLKKYEPVKNICTLLEDNGVIIVEIEADEKFDGFSINTDEGNYPIIFLNKFFSNDRKRFTLAHELGHILMHSFLVSNFRDKENEANRFAAEFLMPENVIKSSLPVHLKMIDLIKLKENWLCSKSAIMKRAKDLHVIDANRYKYLNIELSRLGEKKKERGLVFIDKPHMLNDGFRLFFDDLNYSKDEFVKAFNLPVEILNEFDFLSNTKLKIKRMM